MKASTRRAAGPGGTSGGRLWTNRSTLDGSQTPSASWRDVDELLDVQTRLEFTLDLLDRRDIERARFYAAGLLDDLRLAGILVPAVGTSPGADSRP